MIVIALLLIAIGTTWCFLIPKPTEVSTIPEPASDQRAALPDPSNVRLLDLLTGQPVGGTSCKVEILNGWVRHTFSAPGYFDAILWQEDTTSWLPQEIFLAPRDRQTYRQVARQNKQGPRLILLEFDGMTEALFQRFREDGLLPAFDVLLENGTPGLLESCCGLNSPAVWTTIHTGLRPEEHGIHDFLARDPITGGALENQAAQIAAPRLWTIARQAGLAAQVGGVLLPDPQDDFLKESHSDAEQITATRRVVSEKHPQLLVVYENQADTTGHQWWFAFEPEPFLENGWPVDPEEIPFHAGRMEQAYRLLDSWVALALQLAGPETIVLIVSDHGFHGTPKMPPLHLDGTAFVEALAEALPHLRNCDIDPGGELALCADPDVDIDRDVRRLVDARLADGRRLFSQVIARGQSDFNDGGAPALAVRLSLDSAALLDPSNREGKLKIGKHEVSIERFMIRRGVSGDHLPEGVYFIGGAGIRAGEQSGNASVYDVLPTALTILDLPVGADMSGRVWTEAFLAPPAVRTIPTYGRITAIPPVEPPSPEKMEKLKSLGYIN